VWAVVLAEIGNLVITITLPIRIGNWYYSRIRVIGNVVDSINERRKNDHNHFL